MEITAGAAARFSRVGINPGKPQRLLKKSFPFSLREKARMRGILKKMFSEIKIALTPPSPVGRGSFSAAC
jgi:hypothetical protein